MERSYSQRGVEKLNVPAITGPAGGDDRWSGMLRLIASEYPFCTMNGVHIVDGCVVACEGIQRSFVFGGSDAAAAPQEPSFDAHWLALRALCAKIGSGRLAEIRFSRIVVPQNTERTPMS